MMITSSLKLVTVSVKGEVLPMNLVRTVSTAYTEIPGVLSQGVKLTTHLHLVPR
jgi:hypothetical protein